MKKSIVISLLMVLLLPVLAVAQTSPDDPAVQAAKEETVVVFDLGRFFGFLHTMEEESPGLALSRDQLEEVYRSMSELKGMQRVEPDRAEEMLVYLEDEVLSPDQLMEVDQLAIAKMEARETQTTSGETGTGGGQITSYIAGGPFNPMTDETKTIGKDFTAFFEYVSKKLGK
jgi:hypothetical protein